jgi:hypothetical protein
MYYLLLYNLIQLVVFSVFTTCAVSESAIFLACQSLSSTKKYRLVENWT